MRAEQTAPRPLPPPPAHLHFLGICGYAVSGLALCCLELGYRVSGSDEDAYPPTTDVLEAAKIPFARSHRRENIEEFGRPDLVVLGNQVQAGNLELEAAREAGLEVVSEADAYLRLTAARRRAVICGTHGKTTTSAMAVSMLRGAGIEVGFRLGAASLDFGVTASLGDAAGGAPFVFEGDEYTTSALDHTAKFLHWDPEVVGILNLELDHPDLYPTVDDYVRPYRELLSGMPKTGALLYNAADRLALAVAQSAPCRTIPVGGRDGWWLEADSAEPGESQRVTVHGPGVAAMPMEVRARGAHNAQNALFALATAVELGASAEAATRAAANYRGVARRFQVVGSYGDVTVVDDYAHHPTKLRATVAAARQQFGPTPQLVMIHVPHTFSRTRALLQEYRGAFDGLDLLVLGPIEAARERQLEHTVSSEDVAARAGEVPSVVVGDAEEAVGAVLARLRPPAVVVCSSVRGFDGVAGRLLERLRPGGA